MATETRYCTNPHCNTTWIVEVDPNDGELQLCTGREPEFRKVCIADGYSVKVVDWGRWNLLKDGEIVNICTKCTVNKKPKIFVPYDHVYMCANKDCGNSWSVHRMEPLPMMICGGGDKVCTACTTAGFKISSGTGDGKFRLYKHDVQVATYSHKKAYRLNREEVVKEPVE